MLAEKVEPVHTAVLSIDMVNDFIDPRGKTAQRAMRPLDHARAVIEPLAGLLAVARVVGALVVHVQHITLSDGSSASGPWIEARSRATYSVEDICLEGSWGQEVIEELAPQPGDLRVQKYRYSGFAGTRLDAALRSHGIRTVVCTGVSTNVCVEATAREAFSHEYYVVYAEDACGSWSPELHSATLVSAGHRYATVCSVADLVRIWSPGPPWPVHGTYAGRSPMRGERGASWRG
jgi:ureidoacrylate peracid hydrolase